MNVISVSLTLVSEPGLELVSFEAKPIGGPGTDILADLADDELLLNGGNGIDVLSERLNLGLLTVRGFTEGSSLVLLRLPGGEFPSYTRTDLSLVSISTPQEIARVPEPALSGLVALMLFASAAWVTVRD